MQLARVVLLTSLVLSGCSKDPLEEFDGHVAKVCAATDYKTQRAAWRAALGFLQDHGDEKSLDEITAQVTAAIIDHGAVKQATGRAAKLLTCAQIHGAL